MSASRSKKSSKSSKSRTFTAMTAEELKFEEMDFDKWGADLFDDADEALIRKYIEEEAHAVQAKKQSDLEELEGEEKNMEEIINKLEEDAAGLEERATAAAEKQAEANVELNKIKDEINTNKGADSIHQKEVMGLKELSQDMSELRNKWVKEANDKNMTAMNKSMATANPTQTFIMDSIAQFFTADPSATYVASKDAYFADAAVFGLQIRKCKPEKLDKNTVKSIAEAVNCDAEKEPGHVQKEMIDPLKVEENLPFYVHYKLLFKLCQMAISLRKMNGIQKSLAGTNDRNKGLKVQVDTWQTISDNLAFGESLKAEAERMRKEEIAVLQRKHESLKEEIAKIQDVDFVKEYFASLLE